MDFGRGDIFNARVAGNIANEDIGGISEKAQKGEVCTLQHSVTQPLRLSCVSA